MLIGKIEIKRRIWIGLLCAIAAIGAWWMWSRAKPPMLAAALPVPPPFVRLTGAGVEGSDQVLRERAELFDPTPLFFPTEWNFGQRPMPEIMRRQPGQVFEDFEAKVIFKEQDITAYGVEATAAANQLPDVLAQGNEVPFGGMGQVNVSRPALAERSSFLEVRELAANKTVISQALRGLLVPRLDFAPMEFLVVVSSSGIVGEPVLVNGSRWEEVDEEVDAFFRSYLVKTFRLGERLNPGRYRVLIGP